MKLFKLKIILQILMAFILAFSSFASEKECRTLKNESLNLVAEGEKIQEELNRPSLTTDKTQRKIVNAKMAKLSRAAEDLNAKTDKANCKQYAWFSDKVQEVKWCQLHNSDGDHYCQCEFTPSFILSVKDSLTKWDKVSEIKDADGKIIQTTMGDRTFYRYEQDCMIPVSEAIKKQKEEEANTKKANPFE